MQLCYDLLQSKISHNSLFVTSISKLYICTYIGDVNLIFLYNTWTMSWIFYSDIIVCQPTSAFHKPTEKIRCPKQKIHKVTPHRGGNPRSWLKAIIRAVFQQVWMAVRRRGYPVDHLDSCHWCCQHSGCPLLCKTGYSFSCWKRRHNIVQQYWAIYGFLNHGYGSTMSHIYKPEFFWKKIILNLVYIAE